MEYRTIHMCPPGVYITTEIGNGQGKGSVVLRELILSALTYSINISVYLL